MKKAEAEQTLAQIQHGRTAELLAATHLEDLDLRIEEVIMWSKRYANSQSVHGSLRPARLAPPPLPKDRWAAVEGVTAARRFEFTRSPEVTLDGISGRLLVYFPDVERRDGAAETASQGFFDVHNAPPWGTWIGYFEEANPSPSSSYLLAWAPQVFERLVEQGIAANPEHCVRWLDDTEVLLRHVVNHLRVKILTG